MAAVSSRLQLYETHSTSARVVDTVTGSHQFTIVGCSFVGKSISSEVFTVGGYECVIKYRPYFDKSVNKDYMIFRLHLKTVAKEMKVKAFFNILDHDGIMSVLRRHVACTFGKSKNISMFDNAYYVERKEVKKILLNYKDDSLTIMCRVTIPKQCRLESDKYKSIIVPPSNLGQQLYHLLESADNGGDVTFEVCGEIMNAHKFILAARSPVFCSQFFGPMSVKGAERVKLDDIEAEVFRRFLHFIYSDTVPKFKESTEDGEKQDRVIMFQHLLVAADRYEVERLKLICENKLAQNIKVDNLATTLTLADQHNCSHLIDLCLKFVSSPKNLAAVMKTNEFEHLARSCPSIVKGLLENK